MASTPASSTVCHSAVSLPSDVPYSITPPSAGEKTMLAMPNSRMRLARFRLAPDASRMKMGSCPR